MLDTTVGCGSDGDGPITNVLKVVDSALAERGGGLGDAGAGYSILYRLGKGLAKREGDRAHAWQDVYECLGNAVVSATYHHGVVSVTDEHIANFIF